MGRYIDPDQPYTDEDKEYLRSRGQSSRILENERRFGEDGKGGQAAEDPDLESAGAPADSATFDTDERDQALYDEGGVALPGTLLSKDTGQVVPLAHRTEEGVDYIDPETGEATFDPDHFDDDIIESVEKLKVAELKAALKDEKVAFDSDDNKDKLQDRLIIARQDKRNAERAAPQSISPDESAQYIDPARGDSFDNGQNETPGDDSDDNK